MARGAQGFPKAVRLTKRGQYLALQKNARKHSGKNFLLLYQPNGLSISRLGITVTKKVAGAVGRNRIKRRVREAFRTAGQGLKPGYDLVVVARPGAARQSARQTHEELSKLWSQLPSAPASARRETR